jgi:hypothetical protein
MPRIDGARALYFLRVEQQRRLLCSLDETLAVREIPDWDLPQHCTNGPAVVIDDAVLVRVYGPNDPYGSKEVLVERCDLATGAIAWRVSLSAAVVALAAWPAAGCVLATLTDTTLVAIELVTGEVLHREPFVIAGAPVVVTALAVHDTAVAFATIDGRVVIEALR